MWNYKYRMHDPRVGRFFSVDPLASKYPHNSVYAFSENKVIHMIELEGLEAIHPTKFNTSEFTYVHIVNDSEVQGHSDHQLFVTHNYDDNSYVLPVFNTMQHNDPSKQSTFRTYTTTFAAAYAFHGYAITAGRLAERLDPASGPFNWVPLGFVNGKSPSYRVKSVVGHFSKSILDDNSSDKEVSGDMSAGYGKIFRHMSWMGISSDIYDDDAAWLIGTVNEKSNKGVGNILKNDLKNGTQSMADLINNYWGIQHMSSFQSQCGSIESIGSFVDYLNYLSDEIISNFEELDGKTVTFTEETNGVQELFDYFMERKGTSDD